MFDKFIIKHKLNSIFLEKKIHNSKKQFPRILDIKFYDWGYSVYIDISTKCTYEDIDKNLSFIKSSFRAIDLNVIVAYKGCIVLEFVNLEVEKKKFINKELSAFDLLIGYDSKGNDILINMKKVPHLAIQGLSNMGKSVMIEYVANNIIFNGGDVVLLNSFNEDFQSLNVTRFTGLKDIEIYLDFLLTSNIKYNQPLFIIIDEINILSRNKVIDKLIEALLEIARHYNIYLIGIGQILLKENIKYKQLFNSRITFKHLDKSLYSSFLNVKQDLFDELQEQEFYVYSEEFKKGFSFYFDFLTSWREKVKLKAFAMNEVYKNKLLLL